MIDPLEVERRSVFDYRLCDKLISLELEFLFSEEAETNKLLYQTGNMIIIIIR